MMKYLLGIAGVGTIAVIIFGLSSCCNQPTYIDQWYGSQNFDELIQDYHNALHPISKPEPNSGRSLYIDFSSGIYKAFDGSESNKPYLNEVIAKAYAQGSFDFFQLLDEDTVRMTGSDEDIAKTVFDPKSYTSSFAPIQVAIDKLAAEKRSGILVSDWEDYFDRSMSEGGRCRKEKLIEPFCKKAFTEWLNAGGTIQFRFLPRYTELNRRTCDNSVGQSDKHLYFAFFIAAGDESMNSLLADLDSRWEENQAPAEKFELKQGMKAGYTNQTGGLTAYLSKMGFTRQVVNEATEVIAVPFPMDEGLVETHLIKALGMQENPADNDYWNKGVLFDSEQNALFEVTELDIRVYDETAQFQEYLGNRALRDHASQVVSQILITDENSKATIWDPTLVTPLIINCFEKNTSDIKTEFIFQEQEELPKINRLFQMAEGSVEQLSNAPNEVEINLMSHSELAPEELVCTEYGKLIRVDYIVPKNGFKDIRTNALNEFAWEALTVPGEMNECLRKSISLTAESCGPDDQPESYILYSQYFALNTPGFARNISSQLLPASEK